jgi:Family of unknown function (DUF6152)
VNVKYLGLFVLVPALLAGPAPALAHHGAASFDTANELTLKGTVTEWQWFNPHCFLKFDVKGEDGTVKNWAVEAGNPTDMTKRGWSRNSFKPGDEVTVTLQPVKTGAPVGRIRTVVLANGQSFK